MKAINESELDIALDKLETIRQIAVECIEATDDILLRLTLSAILEVIDE